MRATEERIPVLEVGGTHVSAAWVDPDGWQVSDITRYELRAEADAQELLGGLAGAAASLAAQPGASWGIAMPGPFDYQQGIARYTGVGKFEGLTGVDVRSALYELLPHRPGSISFVNDASAFLIGEWLVGTARGSTRCAAVTLGTGVGSAFLDRGQVIDSGTSVPPQAELHLLQHAGLPVEDWISRRALRRAYARSAGRSDGLDGPDVKELAELARAGDQVARTTFEVAFTVLGEVLGPWLERFGADQLVIGGSISGAWDLIDKPLRIGLSRYSDCRFAVGLAARPELSPLVGTGYSAY
ncbi:MAG: ROK family protein [Jatrophihabitans sp.]